MRYNRIDIQLIRSTRPASSAPQDHDNCSPVRHQPKQGNIENVVIAESSMATAFVPNFFVSSFHLRYPPFVLICGMKSSTVLAVEEKSAAVFFVVQSCYIATTSFAVCCPYTYFSGSNTDDGLLKGRCERGN